MSLPIPRSSSVSSTSMDRRQMEAMDAPLVALTNQCGGDLRRLMFAFFSFLNRRTDFYMVPHPDDVASGESLPMGFREGDAEKLLLAAFRQFPLRRMPPRKDASRDTGAKGSAKDTPKSSAKNEPRSNDEKKEIQKVKPMEKKTTKSAVKVDNDAIGNMAGVRYNEEGLQIPVGNGGSTKSYKWTQTLDECTVLVGLPDGVQAKDLDVKLASNSLSVKMKRPRQDETDPLVILEGSLVEKIRKDDSTWTMEGGVLVITLDKLKKTFWATVVEGDERIDTDLVDSRRHISDYDEVTQGQLRKVMFDESQLKQGLPTSDELLGKPADVGLPVLPDGVEYINSKKVDESLEKK